MCGAEGLPIPEMSWYYVNTNGTRKLLNTTNSIQTQHDISVVECSDTGTYICEANNALFPLSNKSRDLNVTCEYNLYVAFPNGCDLISISCMRGGKYEIVIQQLH